MEKIDYREKYKSNQLTIAQWYQSFCYLIDKEPINYSMDIPVLFKEYTNLYNNINKYSMPAASSISLSNYIYLYDILYFLKNRNIKIDEIVSNI